VLEQGRPQKDQIACCKKGKSRDTMDLKPGLSLSEKFHVKETQCFAFGMITVNPDHTFQDNIASTLNKTTEKNYKV
jgi:hypothetical protein